jgi:hypothetical protein
VAEKHREEVLNVVLATCLSSRGIEDPSPFCYIRSTQAIQSRDKDDLTVILRSPMLLRSLSGRNTVNGKDTEASGG